MNLMTTKQAHNYVVRMSKKNAPKYGVSVIAYAQMGTGSVAAAWDKAVAKAQKAAVK